MPRRRVLPSRASGSSPTAWRGRSPHQSDKGATVPFLVPRFRVDGDGSQPRSPRALRGPAGTDAGAVKPSSGREIAAIAMPVSLEFVLTLVLNFVNQVIVGALGATAIAAVGFANSIIFILVLTLSALGTSVSILVARAQGGGRRDETNRVVTAALLISTMLSALASAPVFLWADDLLPLAGASATVTAAGSEYLRIMSLSAVPTVLAAVLGGVLRSTGHARSPMVATLVTVAINTPLAYGLIFGTGPLPALGVQGAAWATLLTAVIKLLVLGFQAYRQHRVVSWRRPAGLSALWVVLVPLFVLAVPLGLTQIFWTTGIFLYNVVLQRLGDEQLAAAQIVATLEGVFIVGSIGLMSAATVLVGHAVGQGDGAAARAWVARVSRAGVITGIAFGALFSLSILVIGRLYDDVGREVLAAAAIGIAINAVIQVVKVRNMILGGGVLPSGNDVRGVLLGDVVAAFAIGLPLAVFLGLYTPLGIVGVFLARVAEELAKLAVFAWRARRLDWHTLAAPPATVTPEERLEESAPAAIPAGASA
jgi:putative MATE family efflux protein